MKVLAVSLLRIGDLIMATQALGALQKKYPDWEIDLLTNRSNRNLAECVSFAKQIHYFDRTEIQRSFGETYRSPLEAVDRIEALVTQLNSRGYDLVINLTHTRLSAYLCGMIHCEEYLGMVALPNGALSVSSPWFRLLNNADTLASSVDFHFIDYFRKAMGIDDIEPVSLWSSADGISEAPGADSEYICLQAWTSDVKKDYPQSLWMKFLSEVKCINPNLKFCLLGAPDEANRLSEWQKSIADVTGVRIETRALTFKQLLSFLPKQKMLVSVDTSVKHLAASIDLPILEICLGSSNPTETSAYRADCLVLQSHLDCVPCPHSSACSKSTHQCAEAIEPSVLAMAVNSYCQNNWINISTLAEDCQDRIHFFRTQLGPSGTLLLKNLSSSGWEKNKEKVLNQEAWSLALAQKGHPNALDVERRARALAEVLKGSPFDKWRKIESSSREGELNLSKLSRDIRSNIQGSLSGDGSLDTSKLSHILNSTSSDLGLSKILDRRDHKSIPTDLSTARSLQMWVQQLREFQVAKTNLVKTILATSECIL